MAFLWSFVSKAYLSTTLVASVLCFLAYGWDKFQAGRGGRGRRRVSERTLHRLEVLGGWPGALLAQRLFRHKTRKSSYQFSFRLAIAVHLLSLVLCWKVFA